MEKRAYRRCFWCGRRLATSRDANNPLRFTRDHFPARVNRRDFPHLPLIVVFSCFSCNNARGTDDTWIPFRWRNQSDQEQILAGGTEAVVELQGRPPEERVILAPEVYQFIADLERGDCFWGSDMNDDE